jgi:non-canonical purine NTP pyrophosphatase (RdgB/HAM1 family)
MPFKLVTGNANKLAEVRQMLGPSVESIKLDLPEIQSASLQEITLDKVRRAYEAAGEAVVVEDVSTEILALGNFPGPFVKFWEQAGCWDHVQPLVEATGDRRMVVRSGVAYKDAGRELYVESEVRGTLVARRGGDGWGFDFYFVPEGRDQTFAEMGKEQKNQLSHRGQSFAMLKGKLEELGFL